MVVAESFLREDAATEDRNYAFLYQLTHITRDRGALTHDDRVDAVAGAVAHFQRAMIRPPGPCETKRCWRRSRTSSKASINRPIEAYGVNGLRVATWSSQHGWSGDSRPDAEWVQ